MARHICTNCGQAEPIFGENGGRNMAAEFNLPWLGSLPLQLSIRTQTDSGNPSVIAEPQGEAARAYHDIAQRIAANVAALPRDMSGKMRSEERRVGKECVSTCRSRLSPYH